MAVGMRKRCTAENGDGDQSLSLSAFDELMRRLQPFADAAGRALPRLVPAEVAA